MGVRTLGTYVNNHASSKRYNFSKLRNSTIAVDSSVFLYKWMKMARQASLNTRLHEIEEDKPEYKWEWHCIQCLDQMKRYKIKLLFLFDNGHPDEKDDTIKTRREKKIAAKQSLDIWMSQYRDIQKQLDELNMNSYHMRKLKSNLMHSVKSLVTMIDETSIRASGSDYDMMQKIVQAAGLRWIECEGEAEYMAVDMKRHGMIDYIMSSDSDCIACQVDGYITDFNWKDQTFVLVDIPNLLSQMRITKDQFRIACCCMGNDYLKPLLRQGLYWNRIGQELSNHHLRKKTDMLNKFSEKKETLEFCWNLYTRKDMMEKSKIEEMIQGTGSVSPRVIYEIRTTGTCV